MNKAAPAVLLASLALVSCGKSAKVKAMEKFGLIGTWATDCSKGPDHENAYAQFTASQFSVDLGPDNAKLAVVPKPKRIRTAEILSDTKIRVVTSVSGVQWNEASGHAHPPGKIPDAVNTLVIEKDAAGHIREIQDTQATANGENAIVKDGWTMSLTGEKRSETASKERCHG